MPRIYTYKITFIDAPYYYYGVHKEKRFNEYYMGSPKTHKWCWELYEPEKQILEFFEFSDEGYTKAQEIEKQLIKPFFNTDKWCLNENVGGVLSKKICSKGGKIGGKNAWKTQNKNKKGGFYDITKEERILNGKIGGLIIGPITGKNNKELKRGYCGRNKEQMSIDGRKGGIATNKQKWKCLVTGFISNPGNLSRYQKKKNIDTKMRERIE